MLTCVHSTAVASMHWLKRMHARRGADMQAEAVSAPSSKTRGMSRVQESYKLWLSEHPSSPNSLTFTQAAGCLPCQAQPGAGVPARRRRP